MVDTRAFYDLFSRHRLYKSMEPVSENGEARRSTLGAPSASNSASRVRRSFLSSNSNLGIRSSYTSRNLENLQNVENDDRAAARSGSTLGVSVDGGSVKVSNYSQKEIVDTAFAHTSVQSNVQAVWLLEVGFTKVRDLTIWLLFAFVLFLFCARQYRTSYGFHYELNEHSLIVGLYDTFVDENLLSGQPGFENIGDIDGWWNWVDNALVPGLYGGVVSDSSQINGEEAETYVKILRYSRQVGPARLIQLKAPRVPCRSESFSQGLLQLFNESCTGSIGSGIAGKPPTKMSIESDAILWSTARHHTTRQYSALLPYGNETAAMELLSAMKESRNFFDDKTSALAVQFNIYNANLDAIVTVELFSSFGLSGYVEPTVQMTLFRIHRDAENFVLLSAVIIFVTWFLFSEMHQAYKSRPYVEIGQITEVGGKTPFRLPTAYCSKFWNWVDIFTLFLIISHITIQINADTIALEVLHSNIRVKIPSTEFAWQLQSASNYASWARFLAQVNMVFVMFKLLDLMRITYLLAVIILVMYDMLVRLSYFLVVMLLFLAMWLTFSFLGGSTNPDDPYSDLFTSFYKSFQEVMGETGYDDAFGAQGRFAAIFLIIFVLVVVLLLNNFVIAFMGDAYEESKEVSKASWCYLQFVDVEDGDDNIKRASQTCNCVGMQFRKKIRTCLQMIFPRQKRRKVYPMGE